MIAVQTAPCDDPEGVRLRAAQRAEIEQRYGTPDSEPGPAPTGDDIAHFLVSFTQDAHGRGCGVHTLKLKTGHRQPDAVRFYTREGYVPSAPFGHYVGTPTSLCFAKELA